MSEEKGDEARYKDKGIFLDQEEKYAILLRLAEVNGDENIATLCLEKAEMQNVGQVHGWWLQQRI